MVSPSPLPPTQDLCQLGTFDTNTGAYSLSTHDMTTYPAGTYTFTITGTLSNLIDLATFDLELVDPCPYSALTINEPPDF